MKHERGLGALWWDEPLKDGSLMKITHIKINGMERSMGYAFSDVTVS